MTKSIFRICGVLALAAAASPAILSAEGTRGIVGIWDVSVTVKDCHTGAPIRTVRSLQMFNQDGTISETANTFLRGSSVGVWAHAGGQMFGATFWFFRYKPDGTFASIAKALDMVVLGQDGSQFTASGTIQDFDANNVLLTTGCFTHAARRLTPPRQGD